MNTFHFSIPITKVDEEQRIVYGYATKEELDRQGDIVDYEASKKAFSEWAGNIREQHDPKRVIGKKVSMEFDDDEKQVLVGAYVSKSPDGEAAWTKVKEGLFTGFSIGGKIKSIVKEKLMKDGAEVSANRIMDYVLSELSIVDVPACPSAQLVMVKSADGKAQEVEELHTDATSPWFMRKFAYASEQVNHLSESPDNKSMSKQSKENSMSKDDKDLAKATAVAGGVARDHNAEEVEPEINGAPAKPAEPDAPAATASDEGADDKQGTPEEKSAKADVKKGLYTVADLAACVDNLMWIVQSAEFEAQYEGDGSEVPAKLKAAVAQVGAVLVEMTAEEVAEAAGGNDVEVEEDVELADRPADLKKMVAKEIEATQGALLKAVGDAVAGKVAEALQPLEDRMKALESQPAGNAPKRTYAEVDKAADDAGEPDALLQKAADMEAHPEKYTLTERADLAGELFKRSSYSRPIKVS